MTAEAGSAVGIVAANSPAYARAAFDALRRGQVVVALRSADDAERIEAAGVQHVLRLPAAESGWLNEPALTDRSDRLAQIAFTSGTEGRPKGVMLSHRALADVIERLDSVMHMDSSVREYIGVPVYHSFGFGRCRAVAAAGGQAFIPANGFNPSEIAQMLAQGQINAISAVPSLWRLLLASHAVAPELARKVRWIEIGSQAMSGAEKLQLRELFSEALIVQHYGLTEASRSTLLEVHSATTEQLESVGSVVGATEMKILGHGVIAIRGPNVAREMLIDGRRIACLDAGGWYATSDVGEVRDGRLYYVGRADDVINCSGLKLSPDALEAHMRQSLGVADEIATCRIADSLRGHGVLVVAPRSLNVADDRLLEAAVAAAQAQGVSVRGAIQLQRVASLPRTATGKIQRQALSREYEERHETPGTTQLAPPDGVDLRTAFSRILGVGLPRASDTFSGLGGDSLAYIQASMAIEGRLGYVPDGWEATPIAQLMALPARKKKWIRVEPMIWLRALAIMAIVSNSVVLFAPRTIPGGAYLLLIMSGAGFARFQLRKVVQDGSAWPIVAGLPRIVIPVMLLLAYQQSRHTGFSLMQLLLLDNFVSPKMGGFWFIDVWVQIYVLAFLAFLIPSVRRAATERPALLAAATLVFALVLHLIAPWIFDADALYNRVPQSLLSLFALGWAFIVLGGRHRWMLSVIGVFLGGLFFSDTSPRLWVVLGSLALLWVPPLPMPAFVARLVSRISAASLYIYIGQGYFEALADHGLHHRQALLAWLAVLVGASVVHWAADQLWRMARGVRRVGRPALDVGDLA